MTQLQEESAMSPPMTTPAGTTPHVVVPCALRALRAPPYQKGIRPGAIRRVRVAAASAHPLDAVGLPGSR